jgi:hypothetical protein
VSCNPLGGNKHKTIISGTFSKHPDQQLTLSEVNIRSTTPIDTTFTSDDGEFRLRLAHDSAGMYLLKLNQKNFLTLVVDQEKSIKIFSDAEEIRSNYQVEGSEDSKKLAEFEAILERNKQKVDSLVLEYKKIQANVNPSSTYIQMDEVYQDIFQNQVNYSRKFIEDNCNSLASLLVIDRRFGMRKILTEKEDGDYYIMLDSCLSVKYPWNKHVIEHKKRIEGILQQKAIKEHWENLLAVGKKAPDITLEDPQGKSISLHSVKGTKIIVYFWASWDKDSRMANKEMKRVYDMFAPQGLKVYAIGLESYREPWVGAINADGLDWINVTDYLNIQSAAITLFNVPKDFPYFFLLDNEMKIIFKGDSFIELNESLKQ